ncbi:MAG: LysR family transcriptional regulator [Alphaproteobacteria bacterium]|nr:MAG: LysR family transcriptional regulator [Alphaproteobacteria bacterium]
MSDLRGLSIRQLRALSATARLGSITAAAKALHVTPPAISIQLKLLSKQAGGEVLERSAGGFEPTALGAEILEAANEMDGLLDRLSDRINALHAGAVGLLRLGVVSTGKYFAPRIVAGFQRAHPGIVVKLVIGNRGEILAGLRQRNFDLCIMGRPPEDVPLVREELGDHPHVLIAPPDHQLAGRRDIAHAELQQETFLAREEGSGTRMLMSRFLDRVGGERPVQLVDMGTNETIKQAVMAGLGIAIISAHTCAAELAEGKLVALDARGTPIVRQWYIIHRADHELSVAAQHFQSFAAAHKNTHFPEGFGGMNRSE